MQPIKTFVDSFKGELTASFLEERNFVNFFEELSVSFESLFQGEFSITSEISQTYDNAIDVATSRFQEFFSNQARLPVPENTNRNLNTLPPELITHILSFIPIQECLSVIPLLNQRFNELSKYYLEVCHPLNGLISQVCSCFKNRLLEDRKMLYACELNKERAEMRICKIVFEGEGISSEIFGNWIEGLQRHLELSEGFDAFLATQDLLLKARQNGDAYADFRSCIAAPAKTTAYFSLTYSFIEHLKPVLTIMSQLDQEMLELLVRVYKEYFQEFDGIAQQYDLTILKDRLLNVFDKKAQKVIVGSIDGVCQQYLSISLDQVLVGMAMGLTRHPEGNLPSIAKQSSSELLKQLKSLLKNLSSPLEVMWPKKCLFFVDFGRKISFSTLFDKPNIKLLCQSGQDLELSWLAERS